MKHFNASLSVVLRYNELTTANASISQLEDQTLLTSISRGSSGWKYHSLLLCTEVRCCLFSTVNRAVNASAGKRCLCRQISRVTWFSSRKIYCRCKSDQRCQSSLQDTQVGQRGQTVGCSFIGRTQDCRSYETSSTLVHPAKICCLRASLVQIQLLQPGSFVQLVQYT